MKMIALSMLLAAPFQLQPGPTGQWTVSGNEATNSIRQEPWVDGAIYRLDAAPGQISSVALEPAEKLVSVAAGDTANWIIGETSSGSDVNPRHYVLIKPVAAGLRTNLVIATDRRVYQVLLTSRAATAVSSLRWSYAAPGMLALSTAAKQDCIAKDASAFDLSALNFNYRIFGDQVSWRPVRAFDDGRRTFIEFPVGMAQADAPPLFLKGSQGQLELVNYRVQGRYYVVDRVFSAAELRIGERKAAKVLILRLEAARPAKAGRGA